MVSMRLRTSHAACGLSGIICTFRRVRIMLLLLLLLALFAGRALHQRPTDYERVTNGNAFVSRARLTQINGVDSEETV
jgi:hypothetical protein